MNATIETLADYGSWDSGSPWSVPIRGQLETQLEELKNRLLKPMIETVGNSDLLRELAWAANEAAALAWFTICPILVLPTLLEEKVGAAWKKWEKQQRLRLNDDARQRACSRRICFAPPAKS